MKRLGLYGVLVGCLMLVASCGGGSVSSGSDTGDDSNPTFASLSDLPGATSPMASSASASVVKGLSKAAMVGLPVISTDNSSFNANSSMGACEIFNLVKEGVSSAAQADMIMCYVKTMNEGYAFDNVVDEDGNLASPDIYDGQWHIFNLNIESNEEEGGGGPDRVKMRIVKDADTGSITEFVMFMCAEAQEGLVQNEYTRQVIDGTSLSMRAVGNHQDQYWTGSHAVSVSGTLDASGAFLEKVVTIDNAGSSDMDASSEHGVLTQEPGVFSFVGYRQGTWTDPQSGTGTHQDAIYGVGEMLGDTSDSIVNLAMGDGAVSYDSLGTYEPLVGEAGNYTHSGIEAWLGDTTEPVLPPEDSEFYEAASAGELPEIVDVAISFAADETWDCTDDVGAGILTFVEATSQVAMDAACSGLVFDHQWINCWEIIEQQ